MRRRFRLPVAALIGIALAAVAGAAAPHVAAALHSRIVYGTWDPASPPDRIEYCGRRYFAGQGSGVVTREQVMATLRPSSTWREVGRTDGGSRYYALVVPDSSRNQVSPPLPCALMVYLQVGPDSYSEYTLSGGP